MDAIGNIKLHGGLVNDPESITNVENRLQLSESMLYITAKEKNNKEKKANKEYSDLIDITPKAFKKILILNQKN